MRTKTEELVRRRAVTLLAGLLLAGLGACAGLLDIEDSSRIEDANLRVPEAAELWENAVLLAVQSGWDSGLLLHSVVSDELEATSAGAWWTTVDEGHVADNQNAGLERAFPDLAAAPWMVEEATNVLDSLRGAGEVIDPATLARVHLYGAIAYPAVADVLEDFAPSDRTEAGPPLGEEGMTTLYDRAVEHATAGLGLVTEPEARRDLLAARARARHGLAVRRRLRPTPADTTGGGLIQDGDASADAAAALAVDPGDWRVDFEFSQAAGLASATGTAICELSRLRFGSSYSGGSVPADTVTLLDPIDGVPDPWIEQVVLTALTGSDCFFPTLSVTSAREMRLILAEGALAAADTVTFATRLNEVRALEGLTAWTPASGIEARDMLIHERRARLFLTGRRLGDLFRFGLTSPRWTANSRATLVPGSLYPIPASEVAANCHLSGSC